MQTKYIRKFVNHLGTVNDFVDHVRQLERNDNLAALGNFARAAGNSRYLLLEKGVIDFRHFFSAMMQHLVGMKKGGLKYPATPEGVSLLLGVAYELKQCKDEWNKGVHSSCFAREDLMSNRLGARFGAQVSLDGPDIAGKLLRFLMQLNPLPPFEIQKIRMRTNFGQGMEVAYVLAKVMLDSALLGISRK